MLSDQVKERIRIAIANKEDADALIAEIEASTSANAAQEAINADFESRIAALEP